MVTNQSFIGVTDSDGKKYTYMQDLNKSVCDKITTSEFQLRDKRDNKIYWVAKLNDGLCWMTQNLDLDITEAGLSSSDTDITNNWNQDSTTVTNPTNTIKADTSAGWTTTVSEWTGGDATIVRSYDPGVYLFKDGTTAPANGSSQILEKVMTEEWLTLEDIGLDNTWTATYDDFFVQATQYVGTDGESVCSKTKGSMYGDIDSNYPQCRIYYIKYRLGAVYYNLHYTQGNYYSFNAATAGSGKNKTTNDTAGSDPAPDSICPKGWKLPLSGSKNGLSASAALGSFGLMLNKQSITGNSTGLNNISKPEYSMYFVRSGYIHNNGSLTNAGSYGYYWSSTSASSASAYALYFYKGSSSSGVNPSNDYPRYYGCSVRCVAR